jgi:homeobox-leucine zipper protein
MPEFVFANRSGLEMFEATSSSLPDLDWEKTLNENDRKLSYATFTQVLQQVRACAGGVGSKWWCM